MLRLTLLVAAVASSRAFMLSYAAAGLTPQQTKGFEVTAHGLVAPQRKIKKFSATPAGIFSARNLHTHHYSSHTPSTRPPRDGA